MATADRGERPAAAGLVRLAILASVVFWFADALLRALDSGGTLAELPGQLVTPSLQALAIRIVTAMVMVGGAAYVGRLFEDRLRAESDLRHANYKLGLVYDNSPDAIFIHRRDLTISYVNAKALELTGLPPEALIDHVCHEAITRRDRVCDGCAIERVIRTGAVTKTCRSRNKRYGTPGYYEQMFYPILDDDGAVESVVQIAVDVTEVHNAEQRLHEYSEKLEERVRERTAELERANADLQAEVEERVRAEKALRESEARFRSLVDVSPDLILVHVEGIIAFVNQYGARLLGYETPADIVGLHVMDLIHPDSAEAAAERIRTTTRERKAVPPMELRMLRNDGSTIDVQIAATPLEYHGRPAVQAVAHDITARKQAEETVRRMAYYDILTGLPNRALFDDRLAVAIHAAERDGSSFAVMFMDLDDFKVVNDTLGHAVGDEMLAELAARLQRTVRRSDTVARLGGDEFTVLLPKVDSQAAAQLVIDKMLRELAEPVETSKGSVPLEVSIGVAFYPDDGRSFSELMYAADMAMYEAKNAGERCRFARCEAPTAAG